MDTKLNERIEYIANEFGQGHEASLFAEIKELLAEIANGDYEEAGRAMSDLMRLVSRNTDIMEKLGLVEGCLKDSEEYQRLHVDTIKQIIETCRDLYADYKMHHDPRVREVLMKEGLAFPETVEELEIFEKHNPPEESSCDISAEEMLNRIKQKET